MKKIMIAIAVAACAAMVQAAAVTWGSGTLQNPNNVAAKNTVTGWMFNITSDTYASLAALTDGEALSKAVFESYGSGLEGGQKSTTKSVLNLKDTKDYGINDTAYAAILYTWTDTETGDVYAMGNVASYKFDASADITRSGFGTTILGADAGSASTAWYNTTAVPEPTSGLLLLLGMAGLALRRKQA